MIGIFINFEFILLGFWSYESYSEFIIEMGYIVIWDDFVIDDKGKIDYWLFLWVNLKWIEWSGEWCVLMGKIDVRYFVFVCRL